MSSLRLFFRHYFENVAFKSVHATAYIDILQQTIRLLREQISSLEKDKIWLREQLALMLNQIPVASTVNTIDMSEFEPLGGIELPSEKRRRLEEKYRKLAKEKRDARSRETSA